MNNKGIPWFMRLTIQNNQTKQTAFAMYPCDKYNIPESLDFANFLMEVVIILIGQ